MAEKAKLEIVMENKEIRAEIKGEPVEVMFLAKKSFTGSRERIKKKHGPQWRRSA